MAPSAVHPDEEVNPMVHDCLFCRIAGGDEPSQQVGSDDGIIAIEDKFPVAPVHLLVMPTDHVASIHELTDDTVLARCMRLARQVAEDAGIAEGYRIATNVGEGGGQAIPHLHFHVIGGRQLGRIDSGS